MSAGQEGVSLTDWLSAGGAGGGWGPPPHLALPPPHSDLQTVAWLAWLAAAGLTVYAWSYFTFRGNLSGRIWKIGKCYHQYWISAQLNITFLKLQPNWIIFNFNNNYILKNKSDAAKIVSILLMKYWLIYYSIFMKNKPIIELMVDSFRDFEIFFILMTFYVLL